MKIDKEIFWPCMMLFGSSLNFIGSCAAVSVGAHRTSSGGINPFFFMNGGASLIYIAAHVTKLAQVWGRDNPQEIDVEMGRPSSPELPQFDERTRDMVRSSYRDMELLRQNSEIRR